MGKVRFQSAVTGGGVGGGGELRCRQRDRLVCGSHGRLLGAAAFTRTFAAPAQDTGPTKT